MNDLLNEPKALIGYLLTALLGLVMYIWRRNDAETQRRIENLEKSAVTQADVDKRHEENIDRLDRIETAVTGTHRRIDDLYKNLPEMIRNGK